MILVGLGSNLAAPGLQSSQDVLENAVKSLKMRGVSLLRCSSWFRSAPVPVSDQPWFLNGVAVVATDLAPQRLLATLHEVEAEYSRVRSVRNASRTLDLDLLAYGARVIDEPEGLKLPHPRLAERAFVLEPLVEVAPDWRHPITGLTATEMLARLPAGQVVERLS